MNLQIFQHVIIKSKNGRSANDILFPNIVLKDALCEKLLCKNSFTKRIRS